MTELTGSIDVLETGPAPPDGICAPFSDTYQAIADSPDTWIEVVPNADEVEWERDIDSMLLSEALSALQAEGLEITPGDYSDMVTLAGPVDGLFLFSFAFDNGYQTNNPLSGVGSGYLTVDFGSTSTEYWGVVQAAVASVSAGTSSVITGTLQGEAAFLIFGEWQDTSTLSGRWYSSELSIGTGCSLLGRGSGTWTAVAP